MAFSPEVLARQQHLWESKALADVLVVFCTDAAGALHAARAANNVSGATGRLPPGPVLPSTQTLTQAGNTGHKRPRDEGPEWPDGSVVVAAHASQLFSGSPVLGAQLHSTSSGMGVTAAAAGGCPPGPDAAAGHAPLRIATADGGSMRVLVVEAVSQGQVEVGEPLLRLMYTHEVDPRMTNRPRQLILVGGLSWAGAEAAVACNAVPWFCL